MCGIRDSTLLSRFIWSHALYALPAKETSGMDLGAQVTVNHRHYSDTQTSVELFISAEFTTRILEVTLSSDANGWAKKCLSKLTTFVLQPHPFSGWQLQDGTRHWWWLNGSNKMLKREGNKTKKNLSPKFDKARHFVLWQDSGYIFLCFYSIVEFQAGFKKWLMKQEHNDKRSFCHLPWTIVTMC